MEGRTDRRRIGRAERRTNGRTGGRMDGPMEESCPRTPRRDRPASSQSTSRYTVPWLSMVVTQPASPLDLHPVHNYISSTGRGPRRRPDVLLPPVLGAEPPPALFPYEDGIQLGRLTLRWVWKAFPGLSKTVALWLCSGIGFRGAVQVEGLREDRLSAP